MKRILQLLLLINILTINYSICQPCTKVEELSRKKHHVNACNLGHPYTMFDKHNGKTFSQTIDSIRSRIKNEKPNGPVYSAYKLVYDHPNGNFPQMLAIYTMMGW